jgi:hypothetical protein
MSKRLDHFPVTTPYRDFVITPALSNVGGTFIAHGCSICSVDGGEIFRVEVHQVCPDMKTAHAVATKAGMRRIDELLGPAD